MIKGRVDKVADAFAEYPILVNPIVAGTGVKIKLLDALSLGVPAVSTEMGVSGIGRDMLGGVSIVKDGDADGFADRLVELYRDAALRVQRAQEAYGSYRRWKAKQSESLSVMLDLIANHDRRAPELGP